VDRTAGIVTEVERVWLWLKANCRGERNARTAASIARALGYASDSTLRAFIAANYDEFPEPPAGCSRGIFLITSGDNLAAESATHYERSLRSRAREDLKRARSFRKKCFAIGLSRSIGTGEWVLPRKGLFE